MDGISFTVMKRDCRVRAVIRAKWRGGRHHSEIENTLDI